MNIARLRYNLTYRYLRPPWGRRPGRYLVELVESGRIKPCRTIDLGCGAGVNAVYLAQHGFDVTGVDFAETAIEKARAKAKEAGVYVNFIIDDLTNLRNVSGAFDFLLDYGVLDDLRLHQREPYVRNMLTLTHPGSRYLLWGWEFSLRWWHRLDPLIDIPFHPGEIEQRFGPYFEIEKVGSSIDYSRWPPGFAAYLMTRKDIRDVYKGPYG